MNAKHLLLASVAALAGAAGMTLPAGAHTGGNTAAVEVCMGANQQQPATLVTIVDDSQGGSLVWLTDANANLWFCRADDQGRVYVYTEITRDLLGGKGAGLFNIEPASDDGGVSQPDRNPLDIAERACRALIEGDAGTVTGRGGDGLAGDWVAGYFVFIETGEGRVYLCDATADAQVWVFAEIGDPLVLDDRVG